MTTPEALTESVLQAEDPTYAALDNGEGQSPKGNRSGPTNPEELTDRVWQRLAQILSDRDGVRYVVKG